MANLSATNVSTSLTVDSGTNLATAITGATVSNDTITFTRANGGTFAVTTSDADTNTWRPIDDTPVDGNTTTSISSNWAFDNVKTAVPANAVFTDTNTQLTDAQVRSKFSAGTNVSISAAGVISATDNNTTYTVGDGGLTQKNFTTTLKNKLDGIPANANYITNNNQLTNGAGYITGISNFGANGTYTDLSINSGLVPGTTLPQDIRSDYYMNAHGNWMLFSYTELHNKPTLGTAAAASTGDFAAASHTHTPAQAGLGNLSSDGNNLAGNFTATGDITAFSDARVKENIETIDNALDKVTQLRGVEYNRIGAEEKSIGVVAQEIREVLPEVVKENEDGMLSVAYGNITGVLIEAIKEQQKQIEELKAQINALTK